MNTIRQFGSLVFWACLVAAMAIGIEAYNRPEHEQYKKSNMSSFNFLVIMLIVSLAGLFYAGSNLIAYFRPDTIRATRQRAAAYIAPRSPPPTPMTPPPAY